MGYGAWESSTYTRMSAEYQTKTTQELFSHEIKNHLDPKLVTVREARDSEDHPNSTPIILALDVTGSMGYIADYMAKRSLGTLMKSILDTQPISDPQVMFMGIGDINYDAAPLQVSQFESDTRIAEQLVDLWLEGGGGGNNFESYDLAWAFASQKTSTDCFEKRGEKGYLFTIGDELPPTTAGRLRLSEKCALDFTQDVSAEDLLAKAQEKYHVFHIIVEEGYYASHHKKRVFASWEDLIGKRAIHLNDYTALSEVITSVIRVSEGADPEDVIKSWQDKKTRKAVRYALAL